MRFFTALGMFIATIACLMVMTIVLNAFTAAFGLWFVIPCLIVCLGTLFYIMWLNAK
jgi:hypothetical protein